MQREEQRRREHRVTEKLSERGSSIQLIPALITHTGATALSCLVRRRAALVPENTSKGDLGRREVKERR